MALSRPAFEKRVAAMATRIEETNVLLDLLQNKQRLALAELRLLEKLTTSDPEDDARSALNESASLLGAVAAANHA